MIVYYCPRCQTQNRERHCDSCGKNLPGTALRYVWAESALPITDPIRVSYMMRTALLAVLVLFFAMLGIEYINVGQLAWQTVIQSAILPLLAQLYFVMIGLGFLVLALQGRETVQYIMDPKGVLKRTWIEPTRLKCWSRLLRYDPKAAQPNIQGQPFLMAHESYLVWQDVARYAPHPRQGTIKLYRPSSFLFMTLHLPRDEYDGAIHMVAAKLKRKR